MQIKYVPISGCLLMLLLAAPSAAQQSGRGGYGTQQGGGNYRTNAAGQQASRRVTTQGGQRASAEETRTVPLLSAQEAINEGVAETPKQPFPALTKEQQDYLDQILVAWERHTATVERYRCEFTRWQYDPTIHETAPTAYANGILRYMDPDKGLYRVEDITFFSGVDESGKAQYRKNERKPFGEYWVCDGEYVHILDRNEKKATKIQLPPQMRHEGIYQSPLPFLFGVKAEEVKQRYWIRYRQPPEGNQDFWLEAYPKRTNDAANYSMVQVVLDRAKFLPKAMTVYLPNFRPDQPHREHYEFKKREINWTFMDKVKGMLNFQQEFIPTKLPRDWEVIVEPYKAPQEAGQPGQGGPNLSQGRVARPPASNARNR